MDLARLAKQEVKPRLALLVREVAVWLDPDLVTAAAAGPVTAATTPVGIVLFPCLPSCWPLTTTRHLVRHGSTACRCPRRRRHLASRNGPAGDARRRNGPRLNGPRLRCPRPSRDPVSRRSGTEPAALLTQSLAGLGLGISPERRPSRRGQSGTTEDLLGAENDSND